MFVCVCLMSNDVLSEKKGRFIKGVKEGKMLWPPLFRDPKAHLK